MPSDAAWPERIAPATVPDDPDPALRKVPAAVEPAGAATWPDPEADAVDVAIEAPTVVPLPVEEEARAADAVTAAEPDAVDDALDAATAIAIPVTRTEEDPWPGEEPTALRTPVPAAEAWRRSWSGHHG